MKYMFDVPNGWKVEDCRIKIKNNGDVIIERSVDHMIFEMFKTKLIQINDEPNKGG